MTGYELPLLSRIPPLAYERRPNANLLITDLADGYSPLLGARPRELANGGAGQALLTRSRRPASQREARPRPWTESNCNFFLALATMSASPHSVWIRRFHDPT